MTLWLRLMAATGINDSYEAPLNPEEDTVRITAEANAQRIIDHLSEVGFVRSLGVPQATVA